MFQEKCRQVSWFPLVPRSEAAWAPELFQTSRAPDDGADHTRKKLPIVFKDEPRMDTNRDGPPSMTNRARMYLRYRDLDIPTSWEGAPPQPYSCKQPAIQGHSFEQCTKPAFAGFATMVPSPMRARRPRSRVGVLPFTLAPQESVSGCRAAALPCRSCERASCKLGSGTGRFAGNRDVLPISIVGCDASACASLGLTGICCRRLRGSTPIGDVSHGLTPTAKCCRGFAALEEAG